MVVAVLAEIEFLEEGSHREGGLNLKPWCGGDGLAEKVPCEREVVMGARQEANRCRGEAVRGPPWPEQRRREDRARRGRCTSGPRWGSGLSPQAVGGTSWDRLVPNERAGWLGHGRSRAAGREAAKGVESGISRRGPACPGQRPPSWAGR